jgi:hypothetical protein
MNKTILSLFFTLCVACQAPPVESIKDNKLCSDIDTQCYIVAQTSKPKNNKSEKGFVHGFVAMIVYLSIVD